MTIPPWILLIGFGPTAPSALASLLASVEVARKVGEDDNAVSSLAAAHGVASRER